MTSPPDPPARANRPNPLVNPWTFLAIASLAAWFPVCRPYLRVADDFHFAKWLLAGGIPVYFHEDGVWRILGHELIHSAVMANPLLPGSLAIVTHGIASILFLLVLRQILASEPLALLLALLFAVVLCGIATTWLQIGLWRYEATRLNLLVDFLRNQRNPGNVRVEWDSRIQQAWPRSTRHWGMPVESWVLKNGVEL
jgi:hypothetical protein